MAENTLTKEKCMLDREMYPWADAMDDSDFVSEHPSYPGGKYLPLFKEEILKSDETTFGDMKYYVYDPTLHGFPEDRTYPVIYALHGSGGSLVGRMAINWAAAEMFASPEYQEKLGGIYIIAPLANEYKDEDNDTQRSWMTPVEGEPYAGYEPEEIDAIPSHENWGELCGHDSVYTDAMFRILEQELQKHPNIGKKIVFGTSAGGFAAWRMLISRPGYFDAGLIMAGAYVPSRKELKMLEEAGTRLWLCHGQRDELVDFRIAIAPVLDRLEQMPNVELYLPELVKRADGGIASNTGSGFQMGQHCINDSVHENLLYLDGTPMDPAHPDGTTGWLREIAKSEQVQGA